MLRFIAWVLVLFRQHACELPCSETPLGPQGCARTHLLSIQAAGAGLGSVNYVSYFFDVGNGPLQIAPLLRFRLLHMVLLALGLRLLRIFLLQARAVLAGLFKDRVHGTCD